MRKDLLPGFLLVFNSRRKEIYPYAVSNPNVDDKYQVQIIAEGLGGRLACTLLIVKTYFSVTRWRKNTPF